MFRKLSIKYFTDKKDASHLKNRNLVYPKKSQKYEKWYLILKFI